MLTGASPLTARRPTKRVRGGVRPVVDCRVLQASRDIALAGACGDPLGHVARTLADAFDGLASTYSFVHGLDEDNALAERAASPRRWDATLLERSRRHRRFGTSSQTDRFANVPVSTARLYRGHEAALARFRRDVLSPYSAWWQLRVSLYEQSELVGHVAVVRSHARGEYEARDAARLASLVPALRDAFSARSNFATSALFAHGMPELLDEWPEGVFVVSQRGAVAWANLAARRASAPAWLTHICERARVPPDVRLREVSSGGAGFVIAIVPTRGPCLPPRLLRVARAMARGLSDKEIASATGLSLPTVRTYVTAIYRRTGAHNRVRLAAMFPPSERVGEETV